MTETPAASVKPVTNGVAKPQPTPPTLAIKHRAPSKYPRNDAVSPDKWQRLERLVKGGATVKHAAETVKIGYSTAQGYLGNLRKGGKKTPKAAAVSKGFRLSPQQIKIINALLPKMPELRAADIARQAKCHLSSVYHYRRMMLNEGGPVRVADTSAGIAPMIYVDMEATNKRIWKDCWEKRVELTDGEIRAVMTWRSMNASRN